MTDAVPALPAGHGRPGAGPRHAPRPRSSPRSRPWGTHDRGSLAGTPTPLYAHPPSSPLSLLASTIGSPKGRHEVQDLSTSSSSAAGRPAWQSGISSPGRGGGSRSSRRRAPAAAWSARWDSLKLFTSARYDSLPGREFPGEADHYPDARRGRRQPQGLYFFLGMPWQHTRGSALLGWVKDDAEHIARRMGGAARQPAERRENPPWPRAEPEQLRSSRCRTAPCETESSTFETAGWRATNPPNRTSARLGRRERGVGSERWDGPATGRS